MTHEDIFPWIGANFSVFISVSGQNATLQNAFSFAGKRKMDEGREVRGEEISNEGKRRKWRT